MQDEGMLVLILFPTLVLTNYGLLHVHSFTVGLMERELEDHVLAPLRGLMAAIATVDERIERRDKLRVEYERCLEKVRVFAHTSQFNVQYPHVFERFKNNFAI